MLVKIPKPEKIIVKFHGIIVGYLVELKNSKIAFQYDEDWIKKGFSISPISLPLTKKIFICNHNLFQGLYGVFNDSLPSGWGYLLVMKRLKEEGIDYQHLTPLQKLAFVNTQALGALEYYPTYSLKNSSEQYDLDKLAHHAKLIFEENYSQKNVDEAYQFGGSSAGARPKIHIKYQNNDWIVKFPCRMDPKDISKKEFNINGLAKKCGLNVNEFAMFQSKIGNGYFGAKRFDRDKSLKIHMISLAAILETTHKIPNLDYIHLFQIINKICYDKDDLYEAFKRMCFNVLIKNKDDHSRNFSFLYDELKNGYKLSPAYDLTSLPDKLEHEMTINGKGNPSKEDLFIVAKKFNLSVKKCEVIFDDIKKIIKSQKNLI